MCRSRLLFVGLRLFCIAKLFTCCKLIELPKGPPSFFLLEVNEAIAALAVLLLEGAACMLLALLFNLVKF